jgi:hypothetical protein
MTENNPFESLPNWPEQITGGKYIRSARPLPKDLTTKSPQASERADEKDQTADVENRAGQESQQYSKSRWTIKKSFATTTRQGQDLLNTITIQAGETGYIDSSLEDLMESGRVFIVEDGTEVDLIQNDAPYCEIKIRGGRYNGMTAWVYFEALKK